MEIITNYFLKRPVDRRQRIGCCSVQCENNIHLGGPEQHMYHHHLVAHEHHLHPKERFIVLVSDTIVSYYDILNIFLQILLIANLASNYW